MATLVLDNGAYTAKIGYSLEKVRWGYFVLAKLTSQMTMMLSINIAFFFISRKIKTSFHWKTFVCCTVT